MKLTSVRITNFKSVRDSNAFSVSEVTCLVGKNEAGKTSLLEALYLLNPVVEKTAPYDVTDHYPRSEVEDYRQRSEGTDSHDIVAKATFELEGEDLEEVESVFGVGVVADRTLTLSRGYENRHYFGLAVDEGIAVKALLAEEDLPPELVTRLKNCLDLNQLAEELEEAAARYASAVASARKAASALPEQAQREQGIREADGLAEPKAVRHFRERASAIAREGLTHHLWSKYLGPAVPRFLYFDEYYQMKGQVNLEALAKRQAENKLEDSDRPMLGLIELARIDLDEIRKPQRTESLISKLEGASNHLSKQVLKYWSQNKHLRVAFDARPGLSGDPQGMTTGTNLHGRVYDSVHEVSTPLGARSRGFVWFFSFLAWFSQQKKLNRQLILLLDEPGLFLHGTAQGDLLRYIESELKPYHQVLYTTHSPFMVDPQRFDRVRIVRDRSMDEKQSLASAQEGTKVTADVLEVDAETLFPLQGALGYELAQTLFVGPNSLVVEGPGDLLYLQAMSALLEAQGRAALDPRWTITVVGGADKVPTFVALLGAQKTLNVATLIDFQQKDQQSIENLYKSRILRKAQVLTFADFTRSKEADIEDMFGVPFYLRLLNEEYKIRPALKESDLKSRAPRILVRLDARFAEKPLPKGIPFNHYRPARYFLTYSDQLAKHIDEAAFARFETAFSTLNGLLPKHP